jgi:putative toxin-antitoxin system antitoxin component (TIGR02293 family)
MNHRTFQRRKPDEKLDSVASERLALLKNLIVHGLEIFEDQHKFNSWLKQPLKVLIFDNETSSKSSPLTTLDTTTGYRLVDAILTRMEHGVF